MNGTFLKLCNEELPTLNQPQVPLCHVCTANYGMDVRSMKETTDSGARNATD
jgi:hypothetical protein